MGAKQPIVDGRKQCTCCEVWWPATADHFDPYRTKGMLYLRGWCRACRLIKHRTYLKRRTLGPVLKRVEASK